MKHDRVTKNAYVALSSGRHLRLVPGPDNPRLAAPLRREHFSLHRSYHLLNRFIVLHLGKKVLSMTVQILPSRADLTACIHDPATAPQAVGIRKYQTLEKIGPQRWMLGLLDNALFLAEMPFKGGEIWAARQSAKS